MSAQIVNKLDSEESRFVTVAEAQKLVRCSEATIRRLLTKKQLQRHKVFGRTLIDRSELLALVYIDNGNAKPVTSARKRRTA
jgi:excisionase family DNA binding protein